MTPHAHRNRFLASLSVSACTSLLLHAVELTLQLKTDFYVEGETPRFAFFPLSGVASVVALTADGESAEVGFIGCEGLTGAYHLLGPAPITNRCFVQIEGDFLRLPFSDLRSAYSASEEVRRRVLEFVQVDALNLSQLSGCNQLHSAVPRLARWLLMAADRHGSESFLVTHEILAEMIAARRTTVTKIAGQFKTEGLISYNRGHVVILDRRKLEQTACACYEITRTTLRALYQNAA